MKAYSIKIAKIGPLFLMLLFGLQSVGWSQPTFLTNGLAVYYPFNNSTLDQSGNSRDGVLNGGGISFTTDRYGNSKAAVHFAGGGYISITPTPFNVNADYTISFWTKLDVPGDSVNNFLSTGPDTQAGLNIRYVVNSPVAWAFIPTGFEGIDSIVPANYNIWHAIVSIHQSTNDFLYIDGLLQASGSHTDPAVDTGFTWIGRHQNTGFTYDVIGAMDDLRIYNRAFSAGETAQLYAFETVGLARAAKATAVVTNGFLVNSVITDNGFGYTNTPLVRVIGSGLGAQVSATVSNGMVTALNVMSSGSGYSNAVVLVIEPPFILNPVLTIAPTSLLTFSNLTVGSNYQLQLSSSNGWINQSLVLTATNAVYSRYFPGFIDPSTYRLGLQPVSIPAVARAQLDNGFLVGATITTVGAGYVSVPSVTVTGGGGSNATAIAQLGGGTVTNIHIISAGSGYTSLPTLQITPPPLSPGVSPTGQLVALINSSQLAPYDNYQFQFTTNLKTAWSDYPAGLITPTDVTNSQPLLITNLSVFFRLRYVP